MLQAAVMVHDWQSTTSAGRLLIHIRTDESVLLLIHDDSFLFLGKQDFLTQVIQGVVHPLVGHGNVDLRSEGKAGGTRGERMGMEVVMQRTARRRHGLRTPLSLAGS